MAGFQNRINQYPAPGVEGAFAGTNPHAPIRLARALWLLAKTA